MLLSGSTGSGSTLIEFRAGRMNKVGKMVHPDARKGLLYMSQSEDGLMHFCWKDRTSGKLEEDLIIFPGDCEYKRVQQCKTGRVYVLMFMWSPRRLFFWMQEPKTDRDEEYCRRINALLDDPPLVHQRGGGTDNIQLQHMLNDMSQTQLNQVFGNVGQMGGLNALLGQANPLTPATGVPPTASKNVSATAKPSAQGNCPKVEDNSLLNASSHVKGLLSYELSSGISNAGVVNQLISDPERVNKLIAHLPAPEGMDKDRKNAIRDTLRSPQFQQAMLQFSNALQSAQLGAVVKQFQLSSDAIDAAYTGNMEAFLRALQKQNLPESNTTGGNTEINAQPMAVTANAVLENSVDSSNKPKKEEQ
ncbi:proteasomal ubiquitin receptor ADRM1 homolog [Scaptodrosophila lebanonensis]|uniref:Proteasomal ubiquitin receptor ADRM1 homolog n=1 Tax=Drosophila lebanonensis TaxID=7225 RepID=A0A6J2TD55_DROLE|nr:proteasomal ubiquitin receptor ADRM1 homolog [Scaptodrosophila lebanonensis]